MSTIETIKQYYASLHLIESYLKKGFGNLSAEETQQLDELSRAVEIFEKQHWPITPHEIKLANARTKIKDLTGRNAELKVKLKQSEAECSVLRKQIEQVASGLKSILVKYGRLRP